VKIKSGFSLVFTGFWVSGNRKLGNPETYRVYIYNGKV
jgi:hypothetical protein